MTAGAMWSQRDPWWGVYSVDGVQYRITRATVADSDRYCAWAPGPPQNPYSDVGWYAIQYTAALRAAIQACGLHACKKRLRRR